MNIVFFFQICCIFIANMFHFDSFLLSTALYRVSIALFRKKC